jgi:hypothetical protein
MADPFNFRRGGVSHFFEIANKYKLRGKKPKSLFPDRLPEEHPSLT